MTDTTRIYFHVDNMLALVTWLQARPEGPIHALIGGLPAGDDPGVIINRFISLVERDRALVSWVVERMTAGTLSLKAMPETPDYLPEGVPL